MLRNFITGYYHRPRLEQRVFLFIDIEGSTALAERLGEFAFHHLINGFVIDIPEPIVAAYSEIHRYVGDELIEIGRGHRMIVVQASRLLESPKQARGPHHNRM